RLARRRADQRAVLAGAGAGGIRRRNCARSRALRHGRAHPLGRAGAGRRDLAARGWQARAPAAPAAARGRGGGAGRPGRLNREPPRAAAPACRAGRGSLCRRIANRSGSALIEKTSMETFRRFSPAIPAPVLFSSLLLLAACLPAAATTYSAGPSGCTHFSL